MPDPQNNEIETSPSPAPEAVPENTSVPAPAEAEIPAATPAEILPAEAPVNPPNPLYQGGITPASPAPAPLSAQPSTPLTGTERAKELWTRFMDKVLIRKKLKLEKIMAMVLKKTAANAGQGKITNADVQKLLHVSDATATRYLKELTRQGRLKQSGVRAGTVYEPNQ